MYNRGVKYLNKNNYSKALSFFKKEPGEFKEKYLNIGNCYRGMGDTTCATEYYILANNSSVPFFDGRYSNDYTLALNNLGMIAYAAGDDATAISLYIRALTIDPIYYQALWNYSNAYLRTGFSGSQISWSKGWSMYDYRFKRESGAVVVEKFLPTWDGVSHGDTIVVLTEQGLGDKIMFGRYIHLLRTYFNRVIVQCHPSLDCLFDSFEICRSSEGFTGVSIPICSLAGIFWNENPPAAWLAGKFKALELNENKSIGVVWSGSTTHANNANRSCPSSYFSGLSSFGRLYSLNPGASNGKNIVKYSGKTWSDTAALCLALDVVVTVDTSIVHLCGSLGVPCIMVQPLAETDFRWGNVAGETYTNYWYPSVTIVNNPGSWDAAFLVVHKLLREKFSIWNSKSGVALRKQLGDISV